MSDELSSLYKQRDNTERNLRLIKERKSEYVLTTEVPPTLIKEEKQAKDKLNELQRHIDTLTDERLPRANGENLLKKRIDALTERINELLEKAKNISDQISDAAEQENDFECQRLKDRKKSIEQNIIRLRDESDYVSEKIKYEGSNSSRTLLRRAESLLGKISSLEAEEEDEMFDRLLVDEMCRDARDYLLKAIKDDKHQKPRAYFILADLYDYRFLDVASAFEYCCEGIESGEFDRLYQKRIELYPQLKSTVFAEDAREYLIPDIKVLLNLGQKQKDYIVELLETGFFDAEEDRDVKEEVIRFVSES
jgi:hypothetical protein